MELTAEQGFWIAAIVSIVVQVIKLVSAKTEKPISRTWLTVILFVIGLALSVVWMGPKIPPVPVYVADPPVYTAAMLAWVGELVAMATLVLGFATLIYNVLFDKIFAAFNWTKDAVMLAAKKPSKTK